MTLKELIEGTLIGDSDIITVHFSVGAGPIRSRKKFKGQWFQDQILNLADRGICELAYKSGSWDILLEDEEEDDPE